MESALAPKEFAYEICDMPKGDTSLKVIKNIFPYGGHPSEKLSSSSEYYKSILDDFISQNKEDIIYDNKYEKLNTDEIKTKLNTIVDEHIKTVYTMIQYPLTNPATIKFECNEPVTYGMLLFLFTNAYQIVYETEESDDCDPGMLPRMLNRAKSNGRFGIWGHVIEDLCYNGNSKIKIYDGYIVCMFDCDS
jgi:hypothetical protein